MRVKICGITNAADAECAVACGADALGFNFFPGSKRYLDITSAETWIAQLPASISKVAIVVNPTWEQAMKLIKLPFIQSLQLHGSESPEFCRRLAEAGVPFTKAVPILHEESLHQTTNFFTPSILLDSSTRQGFGGTGQTFSWALGRRFIEEHPDLQVVLAGGLTPENVAEAVKVVQPFGLDVTTGVESSPGRKDRARLEAFICAARGN